ncbi:hypothetical protein F183_A23200 [Bryobacterales bacterium F-183]|nr:hypothetical protein F183_A23200 [Bryobacterales bacterium F-183]
MVAFGAQAPAAHTDGHALNDNDKEFVMKALKGGMKEVQMGQLGQKRATNPEVKALAKTIIEDHSTANRELKALAKKKGITVPPDKQMVVPDEGMSARTGNEFDRAFAQAMVDDHKADIAEFEKAAQSATDPDIKSWAAGKLPTLRAHLEKAQMLAK